MTSHLRSELLKYGIAVALVLAALAVRAALDPFLVDLFPYITFMIAVVLTSWLAGVGPALLALGLGAPLAVYFFFQPRHSFALDTPTSQIGLLLDLIASGAVVLAFQRAGAVRWRLENAGQLLAAKQADLQHEIAERRQAEEEFRVMFELAGSGKAQVDPSTGRFLRVNRKLAAMTGYRPEELTTLSPEQLLHPDDVVQHAAVMERVGRGEQNDWSLEVRYVCKDGQVIWVWISGTLLRDVAGKPWHAMTVIQNITERRLATEMLASAKRAAEAASRAKSNLLANISHELRTPMNTILGMTELALDDQLPLHVRDYLQMARDSAGSLLVLLNDILDFSRFESGRLKLARSPFSLRDVLDETLRAMALRAYPRGIELLGDVDREVPDELLGDPQRLRQILLNLVGNGIKFTEQGEVLVRVAVEKRGGPEICLRFAVQDTGIGISPDDQHRIFAPFTQVDASTTRRYGGTGLGLAIAARLVGLMNGRLWVESRKGEGSTFWFTVELGVAGMPSPPVLPLPPQLKGLPVLIVDDNRAVRRVLAEWMLGWTMAPVALPDAHDALERLRQPSPGAQRSGLLVVDALMPGQDGFQLAERVLTERSLAVPLILMMSAVDRQAFAEQYRRLLGKVTFLDKPVAQRDLLRCVRRALGLEGGGDNREPPVTPAGSKKSLRILLAEDTPANQKLLISILQKHGHTVVIAANGREAVNLVGRQDFNLVLMDVQMPIMDGYQATVTIRQMRDSHKRGLPIVAITAHAMVEDRQRCLAAGMDRYITKPIDSRELVALVEEIGATHALSGAV